MRQYLAGRALLLPLPSATALYAVAQAKGALI